VVSSKNNNQYGELAGRSVLVTGAAGFIGSHLTRRLSALQCRVTALVRPSSDLVRIEDILDQIQIAKCDLSCADVDDLVGKCSHPQIVFHLAAEGVNQSRQDVLAIAQANVIGTLALLQMARACDVERFVFSGSCFEYSPGDGLTEDLVPDPVSEYGASKAAAAAFVSAFYNSYKLPTVSLRLFTAYGPYEAPYRLIPGAILNALAGENMALTSGEQTRDFVYIDDVIDAMLKAAVSPLAVGQTINICSGAATSVKQLVTMIFDSTTTAARPLFGAIPQRNNEMRTLSGNPNKARDVLGWAASTSLADGIANTAEWFRENGERYSGS
jgi:nucleoside-diphosphate-sugar epimerase